LKGKRVYRDYEEYLKIAKRYVNLVSVMSFVMFAVAIGGIMIGFYLGYFPMWFGVAAGIYLFFYIVIIVMMVYSIDELRDNDREIAINHAKEEQARLDAEKFTEKNPYYGNHLRY